MKKFFRKSLAALARPIVRILHATGIITPSIILKVDGGIASQMHFYLVGETLRRKGAANLSYDLIWYDEDGHDIDGVQVRNFDLLRLFPSLPFKVSGNSLKTRLYRLLYTYENDYNAPAKQWEALRPPLYLTGYYNPGDQLYAGMHKKFHPGPTGLTPLDREWAARIESADNSVGIHVRRGDLSRYLEAYGQPASASYFSKAISMLQEKYGISIPIFIFSDEPEWVKSVLLPSLPAAQYSILDYNDASRGYIDLWLLSRCSHIIASAGSFGKFAYMMRPPEGMIFIPDTPEADHWRNKIPEATFLPS